MSLVSSPVSSPVGSPVVESPVVNVPGTTSTFDKAWGAVGPYVTTPGHYIVNGTCAALAWGRNIVVPAGHTALWECAARVGLLAHAGYLGYQAVQEMRAKLPVPTEKKEDATVKEHKGWKISRAATLGAFAAGEAALAVLFPKAVDFVSHLV